MAARGLARRAVLVGLLGAYGASVARSQGTALPLARDLAAEVALATQRGQALVVLISLHGCVYCERVRRSHLLPMLAQGQAVVQLDMKSATPVRDFQQRWTTHEELVRRWQIKVAPTLLFVGPAGRELAARMEGSYQPDFYGAYLDERLVTASQQLSGLTSAPKR